MSDVLKPLLAIVIWASLGLGPGYALVKEHDKPMTVGLVIALSAIGPGFFIAYVFEKSQENLETCVLNCGEDL